MMQCIVFIYREEQLPVSHKELMSCVHSNMIPGSTLKANSSVSCPSALESLFAVELGMILTYELKRRSRIQ
jgi:hypothetical protein